MSSKYEHTVKVGIYRTSSIGDVVLTTACLDLLSSFEQKCDITFIGRGASLELISSAWPDIRTLEVGKTKTISEIPDTIKELSDLHLLIDLQRNVRSRVFCHQLSKKHGVQIIGSEKAQLRRSKLILSARLRGRNKPLPASSLEVEKFQFDMMCDALRKGLKKHLPSRTKGVSAPAVPRLPTTHDDALRAWQKELKFGNWLAIAPGAAHPTKAAPISFMIEILESLKSSLGKDCPSLLFVGDRSDSADARQILNQVTWEKPTLNLAGKLSLWESSLALEKASCLLSNDSSLCHISEAVETPVAALFGPTIESFGFAPRRTESKAFSALVGCRPCSKHGKIRCRYDDKLCFTSMPSLEVSSFLASFFIT